MNGRARASCSVPGQPPQRGHHGADAERASRDPHLPFQRDGAPLLLRGQARSQAGGG